MKRALLFVGLLLVTMAHVGSPNVVFDGNAGPYAVRVVVRPPQVVPGLADVVVRLDPAQAGDVRHVLMRPVFWKAGVSGAPAADDAARVDGSPNLYTGKLWLMSRGSYSVYVSVSGARGRGTAIVPVNAFAVGRLGLSRGLASILVVLGVLLLAGLVTIVRAAAGESLLAPGEPMNAAVRRRANRTALVATPLLALLVFGGAKWWGSVDARYQRTMFKPPAADAAVSPDRTLRLSLHDTAAFRALFAAVIPDHGKMMHLFLIKDGDHSVFAHLHPAQTDSLGFSTAVPDLPAGRYRLFGDVTIENGSSITVSNMVDLPAAVGPARAARDSDDSWVVSPPVASIAPGASVPLGDGRHTMVWAGDATALVADQPVDLRFTVRDAHGATAALEPYLGMNAHAVVLRSDDSVFVHLHPMGTVSTAAQEVFLLRDRGDTTSRGRLRLADTAATGMEKMPMDGTFSIPYEFPNHGRYRLWVQVKADGRVLTGTFDALVR